MDSQPNNPKIKASQRSAISFLELVAFIAAAMALNALAIDMMLPALGQIGDELGAIRDNDRQLIVVVYVLGNGIAQLFFGPIVDRFGRKKVLLFSLGGYIVGSLLSIVASTFTLLLAARAFQGVATAATRVAAVAIVRDQCSGRRMAEVMSFAMTIFMAAPILAPGLGQVILFFAPWRGIFAALLVYGFLLAIWTWIRIPETMAPEDRKPLRAGPIASSYLEFVRNRISIGYTMASALCFGALFGYISASEQIFLETFDIGSNFAFAFGAIASGLGMATLLNARIVSKFGMRRLTHAALLSFVISNALHLFFALIFGESFGLFMGFMMVSFFSLGLIGPNATALAMEPMGHNAGAAAAANGFAGTTIAGLLGGLIGHFYDGTTMPIIFGFTVLGISAVLFVLWTERGKLFGVGDDQIENTP
ncbi:multidrug effflux MFS transporter [Hyphococcus lacteus]|uniref:Bcr/CflA family efflux transporter n=1 Tax=Hyphococcus lacteus TaxID=3143536 RepID=A0ABV3Z2C1_9PROT